MASETYLLLSETFLKGTSAKKKGGILLQINKRNIFFKKTMEIFCVCVVVFVFVWF
jgi:hypothetical protein